MSGYYGHVRRNRTTGLVHGDFAVFFSKMMRVGIPRALLYYQYFPAWKTFFEALGAEVVVSPPTTQVMLAEGSARVVADTCLPVKVYAGHVLWLKERCDAVFIPAIRSVERRVYNCSKFLGLPDMIKAVIPELPRILELEIDVNRKKINLYREVYSMAGSIEKNPVKVRRAWDAAMDTFVAYQNLMSVQKLTPEQAISLLSTDDSEQPPTVKKHEPQEGTVAVIGHPYLLYDEFINHRIIHRLKESGSKVVTPEMIPVDILRESTEKVTGGAYWTYENEVAGAGGYYLDGRTDGVIGLMAFGCGPDSLMMDMVRRYANTLKSVPFMSLTLEEHTAEAGVVTRIEAFTDMIYRKKKVIQKVCV